MVFYFRELFSISNLPWYCLFSIVFESVFKLHYFLNEFTSDLNKFIESVQTILIKIIKTTYQLKMILIFIDTLHVISFQKNIFIFKLALALFIFNCFVNSIQIIRFLVNLNEFTSYSTKFIKSNSLFLIKIITTTHPFETILIFTKTLNTTLFQKSIFILKLAPALFIFN